MQEKTDAEFRCRSAANPRLTGAEFRCRRAREIAIKRLINRGSRVLGGPRSEVEKDFFPAVREKVAGSAQSVEEGDHPLALCCVG
jgi:hypothetical protein